MLFNLATDIIVVKTLVITSVTSHKIQSNTAQITQFCATRIFLLLLQKFCLTTVDKVIICYFASFYTGITQTQ